MIVLKRAALVAATALALTATGAVAGGIDNQGKWNPDLTEDAPRYRSYPAPTYTPSASTKSAPAKARDPYEDFDFVESTIQVNGEPQEVLKYKGWIGFVSAEDDYHS